MTRTTLAIYLVMACCIGTSATLGIVAARSRSSDMPLTISFAARVGQKPFACGGLIGPWTPTDLRLFISDVRLISEAGNERLVLLDDDGRWQSNGVALLDFEDGIGACLNGTSETRTIITGKVPHDSYTAIAFSIGVPFELNHGDPSTAAAPLNLSSMEWHWRAGHKFLRFGTQTNDGDHYEIHLGSTNCEGTIGHITNCARPNRPRFLLNGYKPNESRIVLDIDKLLSDVEPAVQESDGGKFGCMSSAEDLGCAPVFKNLGLDLQTGTSSESTAVFYVE
jgi:uncharacterized repeat protein (TIGR04052 family)